MPPRARTARRPHAGVSFDAEALRRTLAGAVRLLERYQTQLNALNVFPVPDGDTGTNMLLTVRELLPVAKSMTGGSLGKLVAAVAERAATSGRGNSGVIFSKYLEGFAAPLSGVEAATGVQLAAALMSAAAASYRAVQNPVEGTMLTVAREAGVAAEARAKRADGDALAVAQAAVSGSWVSLKRTPDLLPTLRDAGVVDAGGQAAVVFLEALAAGIEGIDVDTLTLDIPDVQVSESFLERADQETYGFCTQFVISGDALDIEAIRTRLGAMAQSTVVVGDASRVKVHLHANEPQAIVTHAESLGRVTDVHIENMDAMRRAFAEGHRRAQPTVNVAVVAVAWGAGFAQAFTDLGVAVVTCGRTMNASTEELLAAAEASGGRSVIVLPNNPNVALAAQQAARTSKTRPVHVVATRTLPQGVAAALAWRPEGDVDENVKTMTAALARVRTVEVVRAVRASVVNGRKVAVGEVMGMLDDKLAALARTPLEALGVTLVKADVASDSLVTLYWGGALTQADAEAAGARVRERFPGAEVEVVPGGQPFYEFIASVE